MSLLPVKMVGGFPFCYDLGSSLCKRSDLQGKDSSTSVLQYLTNDSAWTDVEGSHRQDGDE